MAFKGISRRQFIQTTALGAVTTGLGVPVLRAETCTKAGQPKIVYRTLGRTGLSIPLLSFGVMNADNPDLVKKALDMGIKHLDTAHSYQRGKSELLIGNVLKERGGRDKVYLSTKMRFERDREKGVFVTTDGARNPGATEEKLASQFEESLSRLQTDYVDILYLHSCTSPAMVTYEPMLEAFARLKREGRARFIGLSTHEREPDCIRAAADTGVWDVVLTAHNFMRKNREEIRKANAYAAQKGVGIIGMKTQGGVRLNTEKKVEVNHAAALKWVLNDENVCTVIPGITTFDQLALDFGVMGNLALTSEEQRDLEISAMLEGPLYCQNCRACIPSCPHGVRIPSLMRAYMYLEGYGNPCEAQMTVEDLPPHQGLGVCRACPTCTASCPNGIRIHHRLRSLMAVGPTGRSRA